MVARSALNAANTSSAVTESGITVAGIMNSVTRGPIRSISRAPTGTDHRHARPPAGGDEQRPLREPYAERRAAWRAGRRR